MGHSFFGPIIESSLEEKRVDEQSRTSKRYNARSGYGVHTESVGLPFLHILHPAHPVHVDPVQTSTCMSIHALSTVQPGYASHTPTVLQALIPIKCEHHKLSSYRLGERFSTQIEPDHFSATWSEALEAMNNVA